jgi:RNA polymerase sigma factor (sigma-70 family)
MSDIEDAETVPLDDIAGLVARYTGMLCSISRQFRLTREEREDAMQSTWLRLISCSDQIREPRCVGGWLATTMRRECLAVRRRRTREDNVDEVSDQSGPTDVSEAVARREEMRRLHEAVALLPDRERRLIRMQLDPREPRYAEISQRLEMPVGSIGPVRGRALRKLRGLLADLEPTAVSGFAH